MVRLVDEGSPSAPFARQILSSWEAEDAADRLRSRAHVPDLRSLELALAALRDDTLLPPPSQIREDAPGDLPDGHPPTPGGGVDSPTTPPLSSLS